MNLGSAEAHREQKYLRPGSWTRVDTTIGLMLICLAALVPFEFEEGIPMLGLVMTPWEILLLALFVLSGARSAVERFSRPERNSSTRHDRARRNTAIFAALYVTIATAAAVASPASAGSVFKPVLRYATAILLLYITWFELRRLPRLRVPIVLALLAGTLVATLLGFVETTFGFHLEPLLSLFRGQVTLNDGGLRLTGPFHHANEAAASIALSLILLWTVFWVHPHWSGRLESTQPLSRTVLRHGSPSAHMGLVRLAAWTLTAILLATGLVLTLSRSGIVAGLGSWFFLSLLGQKLLTGWKRRFILAGSILVPGFAVALCLLGSSAVRDRFLGAPDHPYLVTYNVPKWTRALAGGDLTIPVAVTNRGARTWSSDGLRPIHLAYHLADTNGEILDFEGARTRLRSAVPSGGTLVMDALFQAPKAPGEYTVIWDLVHEEVTWFSQAGSPGAVTALSVTASLAGIDTMVSRLPSIPAAAREFAPWSEPETVPRSILWPIALGFWRDHPWLGIGPDQFRHRFPEQLPEGRYDPRLHANNLYLELGANSGTLGLGSYLAWIGAILWVLLRRVVHSRDHRIRIWSLGGLALLGVFLLHGLFDTFLEPWSVQGLLALGLGAVLCDPETQNRHEEIDP